MLSLIQRDKTACSSIFPLATAILSISNMPEKSLLGGKMPSINWIVCNWKQERNHLLFVLIN